MPNFVTKPHPKHPEIKGKHDGKGWFFQGWGYKRIAKELRLNRNQVQLYCKTHGLVGAGEFVKLNLPIWYEQNDRCIICGEKLDRKQLGRTKRFCSGKCRTKYYRAKKQEEEEAQWL